MTSQKQVQWTTAWLLLTACGPPPVQVTQPPLPPPPAPKVYVANEMDGTVTALALQDGATLATLDLGHDATMFMGHNVHFSAWHQRLLVTAPVMPMPNTPAGAQDELILVDVAWDRVERRVALGAHVGAAHVVSNPGNGDCYVTAFNQSAVLRVSPSWAVDVLVQMDPGRGPHGMALCGQTLVVANMDGHSVAVVDVATGTWTETALGGMAVQAACAPDGSAAYVTVFDLGQLVKLHLDTLALERINLIATPKGPVQVAVSPDGRFAYVADQGMLLNRPASRWLYQVDLQALSVSQLTEVGNGAHGVALSRDGTRAVVTNAADNTVSFVDTAAMGTTATVVVGTRPNGVAVYEP